MYDWPLPQEVPPCFEIPVHSGSVTALVVTPDDNFIFTCGEDGAVFVLGIKVKKSQFSCCCVRRCLKSASNRFQRTEHDVPSSSLRDPSTSRR